MQIIFFLIYILILVIWSLWLPPIYFSPEAKRYIFIIGIVASWRYTWALYNMIRAIFYKKIYFPRIRKKAKKVNEDLLPEHIFILITTFRIPVEISTKVYRASIEEAINCGLPTTIIASIVEKHEEMLVKSMWKALNPPSRVSLMIVRFAGTGKRDGLAVAFRALTRQTTKLQHSIVALVDGDSILSPGTLLKCASLFSLNPKLGALTTNEDAVVYGEGFKEEIYKQWYSLRFAQRDTYMSSLALSKRVITLTGRMSVYRGILFLDADFAETVQHDFIEHWRLGWFRFLTGDDKSTWYYVLKNGWEMTYVPDAMVLTVEHIPDKSFFKGATILMTRWFGNSLRATYRAMKVPKKVTGSFIWYAIRDQRITMWTGLFGLLGAIFGELKWGGGIFFAYLWWIFFSRVFVSMYYAARRGYFYASWPLFLYFNQIYGSFIKIYILNHLYKQKWTRQKTVLSKDESKWTTFYIRSTSNMLFFSEVFTFIILTGMVVGFFNKYDFYNFFNMFF
jgi:glycosyltransferase Alg8